MTRSYHNVESRAHPQSPMRYMTFQMPQKTMDSRIMSGARLCSDALGDCTFLIVNYLEGNGLGELGRMH